MMKDSEEGIEAVERASQVKMLDLVSSKRHGKGSVVQYWGQRRCYIPLRQPLPRNVFELYKGDHASGSGRGACGEIEPH